jgi:hypothetical protein
MICPKGLSFAWSDRIDLQLINLGSVDGVQPGMEFIVARGPQYICVVVADKVEADYSRTHVKEGTAPDDQPPAAGDSVSLLIH